MTLAMTKALLFTLAAAASLTSSWAAAQGAPVGDAAKGSQKNQMCTGCHGIEGWRTAYPEVYSVPRIGGQHEAYLVKALQDYKSGVRAGGAMAAMADVAYPLSEEEIEALAHYLAHL